MDNVDFNEIIQDVLYDILTSSNISLEMDCFLCDLFDSMLEVDLKGIDWLYILMLIITCDSYRKSQKLSSYLKIIKTHILSSFVSNIKVGDKNTISSHIYSYTFSNLFSRESIRKNIDLIKN